jgi:hypothetical protein
MALGNEPTRTMGSVATSETDFQEPKLLATEYIKRGKMCGELVEI